MSSSIPSSSTVFSFDPSTQPTHMLDHGVNVTINSATVDFSTDKILITMNDGSTRTLTAINDQPILASNLSPDQQKELIGQLQSNLFNTAFTTNRHWLPGTCKVIFSQIGPLTASKVAFYDEANRERDPSLKVIQKTDLQQFERIAIFAASIVKASSASTTAASQGSGGSAATTAAVNPEDQVKTLKSLHQRAPFDLHARAEYIATRQFTPEEHQRREAAYKLGDREVMNFQSVDREHHLKRLDAQFFINFLKQPSTTLHNFFSIGSDSNADLMWPLSLKTALLADESIASVFLDLRLGLSTMDVVRLQASIRDRQPEMTVKSAMELIDYHLKGYGYTCGLPSDIDYYKTDPVEGDLSSSHNLGTALSQSIRDAFAQHLAATLQEGKVVYLNYFADTPPDAWLITLYNEMKLRHPDQIFFTISLEDHTFVKKGIFKTANEVLKAHETLKEATNEVQKLYRNPETGNYDFPESQNGLPFPEFFGILACREANAKLGDDFEFIPSVQHRSREIDQAAKRRLQSKKENSAKVDESAGSGGSGWSASTASAATPADKT